MDTKKEKTPVTDLAYLTKFCEGDRARMKKYIDMFTSSAPALINTIRAASQKGDHTEIANQLHGFKTKWVMMGMSATNLLSKEIEELCRNDNGAEQIGSMCEKLISEVELSLEELS